MSKFGGPRLGEWGGGLVGGGLLLAFAFLCGSMSVDQIRDATSSAATLSPTSLASLDLDEHDDRLVDVEGFTIDCESATVEGERLLAPGVAPGQAALILVAFEHGSDCREAVSEQRGPLRAKAKALPAALRVELGIDAVAIPGVEIAIVEPHEIEVWPIVALVILGALGGLCVYSAFATRKQLFAKLRGEPPIHHESPEADDRRPPDPYRPGDAVRLITEALVPAPALLARLRRVRIIEIGFGIGIVAAALTWASWNGTSIYEREQIWSTGVLAEDAVASGRVRRSMVIVVSTELDVTFADRSGRLHRENVSASSLFVGVDDSVPPTVRYLPDEPERFAVSWIHEQLWGSLVLLVLGVGGLLALGVVLVTTGRRDRRPVQAAAVFEDPREALLELIRSERQMDNERETGAVTHHFRVRDSERSWSHFVAINQPGPLFLDGAQTLALALYHPREPDYLLVLSEDLHELDQPTFSAAQLRSRRATQRVHTT